MLRRALDMVARSFKGDNYRLAPELPTSYLVGLAVRRAAALLRGLLRLRAMVFVGPGVILRCKSQLSIGCGSTIQDGVVIDALTREGVVIGRRVNIGPHVRIQGSGVISNLGRGLVIGDDSGIGAFSFIGCGGGVSIGANVIMGQHISFHPETHVFASLAKPIRAQGVTRAGISIGNDCWIVAKATFLDGARVGSGVVVAAGSVVRGDIPDNVVIGGVPARILKHRSEVAP
jgi:acetyltransferase-like isoleucine patch superfamily enzyme